MLTLCGSLRRFRRGKLRLCFTATTNPSCRCWSRSRRRALPLKRAETAPQSSFPTHACGMRSACCTLRCIRRARASLCRCTTGLAFMLPARNARLCLPPGQRGITARRSRSLQRFLPERGVSSGCGSGLRSCAPSRGSRRRLPCGKHGTLQTVRRTARMTGRSLTFSARWGSVARPLPRCSTARSV